jgi:hypothetical protein
MHWFGAMRMSRRKVFVCKRLWLTKSVFAVSFNFAYVMSNDHLGLDTTFKHLMRVLGLHPSCMSYILTTEEAEKQVIGEPPLVREVVSIAFAACK